MTQGRRHSSEKIAELLRRIELSLASGRSALEACSEAGITEQTYYRWRGQFGHLSVDQIKRMKDLEQENRKLRNLVAGLTLDLTLEGQTPKRLLTSAEVVD
jgi:transposase-like protein